MLSYLSMYGDVQSKELLEDFSWDGSGGGIRLNLVGIGKRSR